MAEIFYTVSPALHRMARLEEGKVVELDFEIPNKPPSLLGAIFWGRVVEIQKPLQAAFVDIGEAKLGLLPLREQGVPSVKRGDAIIVQVSRTENPIEGKGVRLTRLVTLSLGPLLYTPFKPGLNFSKQIKERAPFKPLFPLEADEGVIVRHGALPEECLTELFFQLRREWERIQRQLLVKPPICLRPPLKLFERILRFLRSSDVLEVDDRSLALQAKEAALLTRERAFDERCEDAWESLGSPEIPLAQGGHLYIEETRGLVVIDVNSQGALRSPLSFNRDALQEALRQIRLRDLGGKIVVDLIDAPKNISFLLRLQNIPSDVEIFGLSSLGLLEMVRRRQRLSLPQRLKYQLNG